MGWELGGQRTLGERGGKDASVYSLEDGEAIELTQIKKKKKERKKKKQLGNWVGAGKSALGFLYIEPRCPEGQ